MKKWRYTQNQIFQLLKETEAGVPVTQLCRKYGMSNASFYKWRSKYGGMDKASMHRLKLLPVHFFGEAYGGTKWDFQSSE